VPSFDKASNTYKAMFFSASSKLSNLIPSYSDVFTTQVRTSTACTSKVKENNARRKSVLKHAIIPLYVMLLMPLNRERIQESKIFV
jgi:hypothetical protein